MSVLENGEGFAGLLYKRGKINRSFKERWFIISRKEQIMEYYPSEEKASNKSNSLGHIDLALVQGIEVYTTDLNYDNDALPEYIIYHHVTTEKKAYTFQIISPNRTFILAAISELELFKWLQYLSICIYGGIIKESYVKKQEGITALSKHWKIRYCVLNEYYQLKWYTEKDKRKYLGFIDCHTLSSISNGKIIASELGFIVDLYTKYGNVWYVGTKNENERNEWNKLLSKFVTNVNDNKNDDMKSNDINNNNNKGNNNIFGEKLVFFDNCQSIAKCCSIDRIIKCLHVFNGNLDENGINKILAQNKCFHDDYQHLLTVHLDERNEFKTLKQYILKHIRHMHQAQNQHLELPNENKHNTFYINAMYVLNAYMFGNLV